MEDNTVFGVAIIGILVLALSLVGWAFYAHEITPRRMAEKNLCWEYLPNSRDTGSYQPCKGAK